MIILQTNIIGYQGKGVTLLSMCDTEAQVLTISTQTDYDRKRGKPEFILITNDKQSADYDVLFTEKHFAQAINDYFELNNGVAQDNRSSRLVFGKKVANANPQSNIARDGFSENGAKYRFLDGITNLQIATLATCYYVGSKINSINKALEMLEKINGLNEADNPWEAIQAYGIYTV